jgi:hypothetical protein
MRAFEIITEDERLKRTVIRSLSKLPDDATIFPQVYKQIIGEPLGNRLSNYINARQDQDAIKASKWLVQAIPTLGNATEVKEFISKFADSKFDPIDTKKLIPSGGMDSPAELMSIVRDPFAKKLFEKIFHEFSGKSDAGPGEAALAILSPNITYASPGDISVNGAKIEVKASRSASGKAGRIWDTPINQKPMLEIIKQINLTSFSVLAGEQPFPDPSLSKNFIKTACEAWFGKSIPEIENSFGKSGFRDIWQKYVFDTYKTESGWTGMLALGLTSYQYVETGDQFANNMKKSSHGMICKAGEKQTRGLAPQVFIK